MGKVNIHLNIIKLCEVTKFKDKAVKKKKIWNIRDYFLLLEKKMSQLINCIWNRSFLRKQVLICLYNFIRIKFFSRSWIRKGRNIRRIFKEESRKLSDGKNAVTFFTPFFSKRFIIINTFSILHDQRCKILFL